MDTELKEILGNIMDRLDSIDKRMELMDQRLEVVEFKVDRNLGKINDLGLDIKISERNIRKDIRKLSDENGTIIEILKIHDILPH